MSTRHRTDPGRSISAACFLRIENSSPGTPLPPSGRYVRFLTAADICAQAPERAAQLLVAKGYEPRYEMGLEVLKSLPYDRWRQADPEDTLRFYALRLHEVGMIKTSPQKLIAQSTDWRFLNELKKELKA